MCSDQPKAARPTPISDLTGTCSCGTLPLHLNANLDQEQQPRSQPGAKKCPDIDMGRDLVFTSDYEIKFQNSLIFISIFSDKSILKIDVKQIFRTINLKILP